MPKNPYLYDWASQVHKHQCEVCGVQAEVATVAAWLCESCFKEGLVPESKKRGVSGT